MAPRWIVIGRKAARAAVAPLRPRTVRAIVYWLYTLDNEYARPVTRLAYRGVGSTIMPTASIRVPSRVSIGARSLINHLCCVWASDNGTIVIGDDVRMGPSCILVASNYSLGAFGADRWVTRSERGIRLGNGCWLGAGVVVVDGVTVGEGAVIGAGAVVTADIPPRHLAVGVPAKVVRSLEDETLVSREQAIPSGR